MSNPPTCINTVFITAALILCSLACIAYPAAATSGYPADGVDWVITDAQTLQDSVNTTENLTVSPGGSLTLDNVTLAVAGSITVQPGGVLVLLNSSLDVKLNMTVSGNTTASGSLRADNCSVVFNRTASGASKLTAGANSSLVISGTTFSAKNPAKRYDVGIMGNRQRQTVNVTNSTFMNVGSGPNGGFMVSKIHGARLNLSLPDMGSAGFMVHTCADVEIRGGVISTQSRSTDGLSVMYSQYVNITGVEVFGARTGILINATYIPAIENVSVRDSYVHNCGWGIRTERYVVNILVENTTVANCTDGLRFIAQGILAPDQMHYVYNSTIIDNKDCGALVLYNTHAVLRSNTFARNQHGVWTDPSSVRINGSKTYFTPFKYKPMLVEDNRFIGNYFAYYLMGKNSDIVSNDFHANVIGILARVASFPPEIISTNPTIEGNSLTANQYGAAFYGAYSMSYQSNIISTQYGSPPMTPQGKVINNTASANVQYGFYLDESPAIFENNNVTGSVKADLFLNNSAKPVAVNSSFGTGGIYYADSGSQIALSWYLRVAVQNSTSAPVDNASVIVRDAAGATTDILQANAQGITPWLVCADKTIKDTDGDHAGNPESAVSSNPYTLTAGRAGYHNGVEPLNVTSTMTHTMHIDPNYAPSQISSFAPAATHSLSPTLTWSPATDLNGDAVSYMVNIGTSPGLANVVANSTGGTNTTSFSVPNSSLGFGPSGAANMTNTYYVTVFSDDGFGSITKWSGQFVVYNNVPAKPDASISPASPIYTDDLTCSISPGTLDADGDSVSIEFVWSKDGAVQAPYTQNSSALSSTVPAAAIARGDNWSCAARVFDGYTWGPASDLVFASITDFAPEANLTNPAFTDGISIKEDGQYWLPLAGLFTDPDDDPSTMTYAFAHNGTGSGHVSWGAPAMNGSVRLAPDAGWFGEETYTITVDSHGRTTGADIVVSVAAVNDAPILLTVGGKAVAGHEASLVGMDVGAWEGRNYTLEITAGDADISDGGDDALVFSANDTRFAFSPGGSPDSANATFVPGLEDVITGRVFISITVRSINDDDPAGTELSDWVNVTIGIYNTPDAPVLLTVNGRDVEDGETLVLDGADGASEDVPFLLNITADDPDLPTGADSLEYRVKGAMGSRFVKADKAPDTRWGLLEFTPDQEDVGEVQLTVNVTDRKGLGMEATVLLAVANTNDAPEAPTVTPTVMAGVLDVTFTSGVALDADLGTNITYTWDFGDGQTKSGVNLLVVNHTYAKAGTYIVNLTVSDGELTNTTTTTVTVTGQAAAEDSDGDGLPDEWEMDNFGNLDQDGSGDADGDGYTNAQEQASGTDPTDEDSNPETPDGGSSNNTSGSSDLVLWILIAVAVVAVVAAALFFVLRARRKDSAAGPPAQAPAEPEPRPEVVVEPPVQDGSQMPQDDMPIAEEMPGETYGQEEPAPEGVEPPVEYSDGMTDADMGTEFDDGSSPQDETHMPPGEDAPGPEEPARLGPGEPPEGEEP